MSSDAAAAPWADLVPELLDLVADCLDPISYLRFPATCTGWAAACELKPRLRSGTPTLLTSRLDDDGYQIDVEPGAFALHDVTGKLFLGESEELTGRTWIGGKADWLVTSDGGCNIELLNPVTGAEVRLPSFATIPGVEVQSYDFYVRRDNDKEWLFRQSYRILKVTLCRTPDHPKGYLAIALFSSDLLAVTAAGDECWTALKNDPAASLSRGDLNYMDAIVVEGKLFAVNKLGRVYSWDMSSEAPEPEIVQGPEIVLEGAEMDTRRYDGRRFYLATSSGSSSRLLLVHIYGDAEGMYKDDRIGSRLVFDTSWSFFEMGMELHELDVASGAWRRVMDLAGDRALFLGSNYPFYVDARGVSEHLQANGVYVADAPFGDDAAIFDPKEQGNGINYNIKRLIDSPIARAMHLPMWFRPTAYSKLPKDDI